MHFNMTPLGSIWGSPSLVIPHRQTLWIWKSKETRVLMPFLAPPCTPCSINNFTPCSLGFINVASQRCSHIFENSAFSLPHQHVCFRTATWHENASNEMAIVYRKLLSPLCSLGYTRLIEVAKYVSLRAPIDIEMVWCRIWTFPMERFFKHLVRTSEESSCIQWHSLFDQHVSHYPPS